MQSLTLGCRRQGQTQAFFKGTAQTCVLLSYHQSSHSNKTGVPSKYFRGIWKDLKKYVAPPQCGLHCWADGPVCSTESVSGSVVSGHSSFQFLEGQSPRGKHETCQRAWSFFSHFVLVSCHLGSASSTGQYKPGSVAAKAVVYRCSNTLYLALSFMDDSTSREEKRGERCVGPLVPCPALKLLVLDAMPLGYSFSFLQY